MNCDQVKEILVEYLLNELPVKERSTVDLHLRQGCAECLACEEELIAGIEVMFDGIANEPFDSNQREAILAAAINRPLRQQNVTSSRKPDFRVSFHWAQLVPYSLALAAGVLVMLTIAPLGRRAEETADVKGREVRSRTFAVDPSTLTQNSELSEEKSKKSRLVSMNRANIANMTEGRILWDALSHDVHFFGKGIPSPPSGMRYVLWLLGEDQKALGYKELTVNSNGLCKATASDSTGKIRYIFITLESNIGQFDRPSNNVELTLDTKRFDGIPF